MLTVSLSNLRLRARRRADMENSQFISDAEANDMINEAYCELYDLLVSAYENYYAKWYNFTTTPGTVSYALPSDFYKLISLDMQVGNLYATLYPYQEMERNASLATSYSIPASNLRMRYVPNPTLLVNDSDAIDFINGWEALLITDVAVMMLEKEESDTAQLEARRERQYQRVMQMSHNRDITMPSRVTDITLYDNAYVQDTLRYRLYGTNVEFIAVQYIGV